MRCSERGLRGVSSVYPWVPMLCFRGARGSLPLVTAMTVPSSRNRECPQRLSEVLTGVAGGLQRAFRKQPAIQDGSVGLAVSGFWGYSKWVFVSSPTCEPFSQSFTHDSCCPYSFCLGESPVKGFRSRTSTIYMSHRVKRYRKEVRVR